MSRLTDPARLQKEIEAQKKRAAALALLNSTGGEQHYKPGEVRKAREEKERDNTLEVVTMRRAHETYKDRLLQQQNSHREGLEQKKSKEKEPGPLKDGWREVKDAKTGATYYWNKSSNTTSWTRPVASSEDPPNEQSSSSKNQCSTGKAFTDAAASGAGRGNGADNESETPAPLPAGWTEIKDPKTGGIYFWNQGKGETTWVRPAGLGGDEGGGSAEASNSGLPAGWKAVSHAATGQLHYVNEATGQKSHTRPGSDQTRSDQQQTREGDQSGRSQTSGGKGDPYDRKEGPGARGRNGQDRRHSGRDAKRRRGGREEIDPLDPLGKAGGKWSDGLVQVGERMADSTASGPLWQQRPYPAPGKILRAKAPSESETAGPRQRG